MKEATGELDSAVIVVVAVAALATFFFSVLWPMFKHNYQQNSKCSDAVCGFDCNNRSKLASNGSVTCCYTDKTNNKKYEITCAYKG